MSSRAVDDDRLRAALQPDAPDHRRRRVHRGVRRASRRRSRRISTRIVELNRGPFVGAQPPRRGARRTAARAAAARRPPRRRTHLAGHRPGAINVPVVRPSFATKAGFVLDASAPVCVLAATADEAGGRRGAPLGRVLRHRRATSSGRRRSDAVGVTVDELEELIASGATVIDVREKDERDDGFIPGSRNVPYRLLRDLLPRPPATTARSSRSARAGPRAAIAASILRARGHDARPVVDGGMDDWPPAARRRSRPRCGS